MLKIFANMVQEIDDFQNNNMSDILSQLKNLGVTLGMPEKPYEPPKQPVDIFHALEKAFPNGNIDENFYGPYFINRCIYPKSYTHGRVRLNQDLINSRLFSTMIDFGEINIQETLAMDTETSGLSANSASFVFMIGMGHFIEDQYVVEQLILPDLTYEKAFLYQIETIFARYPILLTYNGKSFDIPMIRGRCNFHMIPDFCSENQHVDLLPIARKFWNKSLPNCRLSTMEKEVLKIQRDDQEVPGFMAPELYRDFLNTSDGSVLIGIAYHNEIDVLSLSAFLLLLNQIAQSEKRDSDFFSDYMLSGPDFYRNSALLDPEETDIQSFLTNPYMSNHDKQKVAVTFLKIGAKEKAIQIYKALADEGDLKSCLQAAYLYEKEFRNYDLAIMYLQKGVELLNQDEILGKWSKIDRMKKINQMIEKNKEKKQKNGE